MFFTQRSGRISRRALARVKLMASPLAAVFGTRAETPSAPTHSQPGLGRPVHHTSSLSSLAHLDESSITSASSSFLLPTHVPALSASTLVYPAATQSRTRYSSQAHRDSPTTLPTSKHRSTAIMFQPFSRRAKTAPSHYPRVPFHLLRFGQLLASLIVGGIMSFFMWHLTHDHWQTPWTFILV